MTYEEFDAGWGQVAKWESNDSSCPALLSHIISLLPAPSFQLQDTADSWHIVIAKYLDVRLLDIRMLNFNFFKRMGFPPNLFITERYTSFSSSWSCLNRFCTSLYFSQLFEKSMKKVLFKYGRWNIISTHVIDADVGLGRGLHEGRGGAEALAERLALCLADHPQLLQVTLVAHHHYRGQLARPVNILNNACYCEITWVNNIPGCLSVPHIDPWHHPH